MAFIRKNFARGTLASNVNIGEAQLTVQAGHTLPISAGQFRLVIWDKDSFPDPADDSNLEIVTAEYSGTPNIYDITRAQENTSDVQHNSGNRVALHYTAGMSEDDLYESSDFNTDFATKDLDDLAAGITNIHLTTSLKSYYDTAYGWGNHADAGYLLAETDPIFGASPASGINAGDITNWDAAYNHISNDGSDHSFINQDVTSGASPTFAGETISNATSANIDYTKTGGAAGTLSVYNDTSGHIKGETTFTAGLYISATTLGLRHTADGANVLLLFNDKISIGSGAEADTKLHVTGEIKATDLTITTPVNIYALSHDSFADFDANKHIDHTGVTLTAGKGLSGGGTIAANRTFALDLTEMTGNVVWDDNTTDASITWTYALSGETDPVWTIGNNSMDLTAGVLKVGGTTVMLVGDAPAAHLHDGNTLELDGVNSDGGAFSFTTTGLVTFNQSIASANFAATNKLTVCATNAGVLDFSAASKMLTVEDNAVVNQDYSSDASPTFAGLTVSNATSANIDFTKTGGAAGTLSVYNDPSGHIKGELTGTASLYISATTLGLRHTADGASIITIFNNKVRIGTEAEADTKLHVDGEIKATDLTITTPVNIYALSHNSFADYAANRHFLESEINHEDIINKHQLVNYGETPFISNIELWGEKVTNGDFDSATTGWTTENCTIASVAGGVEGNCLEITKTGGTCQLALQVQTYTTGETYRVSFWVKQGTATGAAFRVGVGNSGVDWNPAGYLDGTTTSEWVHYSFTFVARATDDTLNVGKNDAAAGTILFDKVKMSHASGGEAGTSTIGATNSPLLIFDHVNDILRITGCRLCTSASDPVGANRFEFQVQVDVPQGPFSIRHARNDGNDPITYMKFYASRGTLDAPAAVLNNDTIAGFQGWGYGASDWSSDTRAQLVMRATENWTNTAQGADIRFFTTDAGGTTLAERMRIGDDGGIFIYNGKSGATQIAAGAAANELWKTNGHDTLPDNVVMIGV